MRHFTIILSLLIVSFSCIPQVQAQSRGKRYCKIGNLKVDTAFYSTYWNEFNVPYGQFKDLHQDQIKIKFKPIKTTMAAHPRVLSLFFGKKNRRYKIVVGNKANTKGININDVPSNAQIGIFAHELMHIRDYQDRNFWNVLAFGFSYLSKQGKRNTEYRVDKMAIDEGYGQNLYEWSDFALNKSKATDRYIQFKKEVYMLPEEIQEYMLKKDQP